MSAPLGELQQLTLLAVARLGRRAYGAAIRDELEQVAGRRVSVATVYVTLVRLEEQDMVTSSRDADHPTTRGGKPRRYFTLTPAAWVALRTARHALESLWRGLEEA